MLRQSDEGMRVAAAPIRAVSAYFLTITEAKRSKAASITAPKQRRAAAATNASARERLFSLVPKSGTL